MPHRVPVALGARSYDVHVGTGLLAEAGRFLAGHFGKRRAAILTDSNVARLHAPVLEASLRVAGIDFVRCEFPAGESSKSMSRAGALCDRLIEARLDRSSYLIALGGGVTGDLAGFVASIYYRGIPYVQIPTTVVAQVDSSVGGKTGVNSRLGKNLIGAFHQPALVLADTGTLATLPDREFFEGMAEVVKHAIIRDPALFERLQQFDRADTAALPDLIARNVEIKAAIVSGDEHETKGLRALLNFGHTIGHGIENAAGYGTFLHGEAIALGILAATHLSVEKAGLAPGQSTAIAARLAQFHLPAHLPASIPTGAVLKAMRTDKKFASGKIRFVLAPRIGEAFVSEDVSEEDIRRTVDGLRSH